ncbi:AGE family epimerase/isomerase [Polaromonas sp. JS666]|uniref:AGE family epimerase/isomerase n=1 Tax=Polaromonas sp. (strain JS666 / ATCC BAA-500) TaxID=296591 RepID=UPI000891BAC5|nr:AGE family epimerase/isomerase [Polaromonas sp. JS666]SDN55455.1 mannose-6-phosphate isomerase, type 3 [Polaromonas sp. JS666]
MPPESFPSFLADTGRHARHWLFESALPLWWERGADHEGGGFHEKLGQDGKPIGKPVRVRVQARQTYVYARAGALGWSGPWQAAMRHGLSFMLSRYPRPDGLFRSTLDTSDESIDLYDQAFVLFALAHAYEAEGRPRELLDTAQALLRQIEAALALSEGGYYDGLPRQPILKSNPLMHLLEALLAWVAMGVEGRFRAAALALCELATARLINPANGAIGELFTTGWAPLGAPQERLHEPGHQFEWAYLLLQAEGLLGINARSEAIALEKFGRSFGIASERQVALFAVDEAGTPTDRRARLWAQTERLRTSLLFATQGLGDAADTQAFQAAAAGSFSGLMRFLATDVPGLWHEWQREDGGFDPAPSPASSLYHLMTGLEGLSAFAPPLTPAAHRPGIVERTITA